jgi:phosphoglucomutase
MTDYQSRYAAWRAADLKDASLKQELERIAGQDDEIYDRFYKHLKFGTAGLRGLLGAGTNRMNIITVGRAVAGLAAHVKAEGGAERGVAIAYDNRIGSELFARRCASVLAAAGVRAHLFSYMAATPILSFAVRQLGCAAGIVITASHNPAEYNGLKVYGPDGGQLDTEDSAALYTIIESIDPFSVAAMELEEALSAGLIVPVPDAVIDRYLEAVKGLLTAPEAFEASGLRVVYTPLYGTGLAPVERLLGDLGLSQLYVVPEQREPDGHFPTAPYPNPEAPAALTLALELARAQSADLVVATDPDADRLSVAVRREDGDYIQLSGNQMGCLLFDYMADALKRAGRLPEDGIAIRSVVSTPMFDAVAAHYGLTPIAVLTGFKNVATQLKELDKAGETHRFVFAFEESNGFMPGAFVRDKDGIAAALLFTEMAAVDKMSGRTLLDRLEALYERFGHYATRGHTLALPGAEGMARMAQIMADLRSSPPSSLDGLRVVRVDDYAPGFASPGLLGTNRLPPTDMLMLHLEDGSLAVVRPSGTEPKLKLYLMCKATTAEAAAKKVDGLVKSLTAVVQ